MYNTCPTAVDARRTSSSKGRDVYHLDPLASYALDLRVDYLGFNTDYLDSSKI